MTDRETRWAGYAGSLIGLAFSRVLADRFPTAAFLLTIAMGAIFVIWLIRDSLRFRKEVAEHQRHLAERKAAHRAAKEEARQAAKRQ